MATPAATQQAAPEPAPAPVADTKVVSTATSDTESGGQTAPKPARTITQRLSEELDVSKAFIPMLVCCFLSGLTDGTIYNAYKTFVSMQTGNTIFVALGTTKHSNPYGWARSLMSIGCFAIGSLTFARIYILIGGRRRGTLIASFAFQAICVMIAAAVIQGHVLDGSYPSKNPPGTIDFHEFVPIALLSFQAAGQIVSSRSLGVNELPTVVITSMVCDLMSDPLLFANQRNDKRNRRAIAFVLTLVGAIAGGGISEASGSVQASLWLVCGIKFALAVTWMFWVKKEEKPKAAEPKA